jgi:hypothetical protein
MPQHADVEPISDALDLRGKVLYIEDNPINVDLVEAALSRYPGIGGLEVVRALNEQIANEHLRVTLLTADSLSMDIVKAMSLGAYDYWLKPIDMRKFEAGLQRALGKGSRRE